MKREERAIFRAAELRERAITGEMRMTVWYWRNYGHYSATNEPVYVIAVYALCGLVLSTAAVCWFLSTLSFWGWLAVFIPLGMFAKVAMAAWHDL